MDSNDALHRAIAAHDGDDMKDALAADALKKAEEDFDERMTRKYDTENYMGAFQKLSPKTVQDYIEQLRQENERLRAESKYLVNVLRGVEHTLESCDDAEASRVQREVGRILASFDGSDPS